MFEISALVYCLQTEDTVHFLWDAVFSAVKIRKKEEVVSWLWMALGDGDLKEFYVLLVEGREKGGKIRIVDQDEYGNSEHWLLAGRKLKQDMKIAWDHSVSVS